MKNSSGEVIVDFCFRRASQIVVAASALFLIPSFVVVPSAKAQATAPSQPTWKDRDEYDAGQKVTTATDMKVRLEALKAWEDKYPKSDLIDMRNGLYLDTYANLAGKDPSMVAPLLKKAQELLDKDPKNPRVLYMVAYWGPRQPSAGPDVVGQVEADAHALIAGADDSFSPAKKPAGMTDAAWAKFKITALAQAHQSLAWAAETKKDYPTAESEYKESLTINPEDAPTSVKFGKLLIDEKDDKKYPLMLFEYARAGQYTGPGPSLSAAGRTSVLDFFNKQYKGYHGSDEGKDQVLALAKTAALPPAGWGGISSIQDAENEKASKINDRIKNDPAFGLWYAIKQQLTTDNGPAYFVSQMKEVELPGGANGVKTFSGTILTVEPAEKPTRITVGIEDPTKADATLLFTTAIPVAALTKIKVGEKVDFTGIADSYTKEPYMVTFKDPDIPGVQLAPPPPKPKGRKR